MVELIMVHVHSGVLCNSFLMKNVCSMKYFSQA